MYNKKDIQHVGKHDFDKDSAMRYANYDGFNSFSVNIFKWLLSTDGKFMKPSKGVVRVKGNPENIDNVLKRCEEIVLLLDNNEWHGKKSETVK